MTFYNFYIIKNKNIEKKVTLPLLYSKQIVRNKDEILNSYNIDFYFKIKAKHFNDTTSKKAKIGSSIYLKEYNNIRQIWKDIKFNIFFNSFNNFNLKITKTLNLFFKFIRKKEKKKQYTIVIKPLKGGFLGFFGCVSGYIPATHYKKIIKKPMQFFKTNKYCFFRILLFIEVKIRVTFFYRLGFFKKKKKKNKARIFRNRLNFIFLNEKRRK